MDTAACLERPAVVTGTYQPAGKDEALAGLKAYVTGPPTSTRGVIFVYDIFGVKPQTQQGADRLAASLNAVVVMPDFFEGGALGVEIMPADTKEKNAVLAKFRKEKMPVDYHRDRLLQEVMPEAKKRWPEIKKWGVFGLCWGGKIAAVVSAEGTPFSVSGQAHPAFLAREDAANMVTPHINLASPGEPADIVREYATILGDLGEVDTYHTMFHGWMGARANLQNEENAKEFERGYNQVAEFFAKHL